jgi:O-6-methylguanine DNA methyltransferase
MQEHSETFVWESYQRSRFSLTAAKNFFSHLKACPTCRQHLRHQLHHQAEEYEPASTSQLVACHITSPFELGFILSSTELWAVTLDRLTLYHYLEILADRVRVTTIDFLPEVGKIAIQACQNYLLNGKPLPILPLNLGLVKSLFQREVLLWTQLIPYGATVAYADLADWMGKPGAFRAVGAAEKANPLPLFIPCHRVIGRNGQLIGFGGGLALKQKLLDLEQNYLYQTAHA